MLSGEEDDEAELEEQEQSSAENDDERNISFYNEDETINRTNKINFALANARSVAAKIPSLIDMFRELNLHFVLLTETWLRSNVVTKEEIERLSEAENIGMICKNRDGRGGGVAVAFDQTTASFKKFHVTNAAANAEIVAVSGKIKNIMRKFLLIVVYIPPSQLAAQTHALWDSLADTIENGKRQLQDPYIIVGGDTNRRPLRAALEDFPDVTVLDTGPTRGTARLDEVAHNLGADTRFSTFVPLENEHGVMSDHDTIICRASIPKLHKFKTTVIEYRVYNEEAVELFGRLMLQEDWDIVRACSSSSSAAVSYTH